MTPTTHIDIPLTVPISPRAARSVKNGHRWIFANEMSLTKPFPEKGTWCRFTAHGETIATGTLNPHSLIAGRIFAPGDASNVEEILRARLTAAFALRRPRFGEGACRLAFSEADGVPGLVIDWSSGVLVLQFNTAGIDASLLVLETLVPTVFSEVFGETPEAFVVRADTAIRKLEGVENFTRMVFGDPGRANAAVFTSGGVRYAANLLSGQKTGFFLDQADNRAWLGRQPLDVTGKTVLDLFAYSGGWGLRALREGAAHATFVDESGDAVELIRRGLKENGIPEDRATVIRLEVFDFLRAESGAFDVVVSDPPAFVKTKKDLNKGQRAYQTLTRLAWRRLGPGGCLIASTCSHHVPESTFLGILRDAVAAEGSAAHVVRTGAQAWDHPVLLAMPETRYLTCALLRRRPA